MGPREMMLAVGLPGAVSTVLLVVGVVILARLTKGRDAPDPAPARGLSWLVVLLMACGVVMGSYAWQSRVELWPSGAPQRFPFVAMIAGLAGLVGVVVPSGRWRWGGYCLTAVFGVAVAWSILSLLHGSLISEPMRWVSIVGMGCLAGVYGWMFEKASAQLPGWRWLVLMAMVVGLIAVGATEALVNAPLILGPVGAVLGAAVFASVVRPTVGLSRGVGAFVGVLLVGVLVLANWFGDYERWLMLGLLVGVPIPLGLCSVPVGKPVLAKMKPNTRFAVLAVMVFAIGAVQCMRAIPPLLESMNPPAEDEYSF